MLKVLTITAALLASTAAAAFTTGNETKPADADVWRGTLCGSGPHGGSIGTCHNQAQSVAVYFQNGGKAYANLCGQTTTGPSDYCKLDASYGALNAVQLELDGGSITVGSH